MAQSGTTSRRRTRVQRVLAFVSAVILIRFIINARTSSSKYLPETSARGSGHGSLKGKLDDIYNTESKWAPTAATNSNVMNSGTSDDQRTTLDENDDGNSVGSENLGRGAGSLSVSVASKKTTSKGLDTENSTPGLWSDASEHKRVMMAIGEALTAIYPNRVDRGKLVMATVANEAFLELLMNWLAFTQAHDVMVIVGALDEATAERCKAMSVPAVQLQAAGLDTTLISLDEHEVKNQNFRGSKRGFQNYGVRKLSFLLTLLELGLDVSLSDTDVVWKKRFVAPNKRTLERRWGKPQDTDKLYYQQPRRFIFRKERHICRYRGCSRHKRLPLARY